MPSPTRPPFAALLWLTVALAACQGRRYDAECEAALRPLGVGYENVQTPPDEAARDRQAELIARALAGWSAAKPSITLPNVRRDAEAIEAVLAERKALLAALRFDGPRPSAGSAPGPGGTTPAALATNARKYAEVVGALAGTCAERQ